MRRALKRFLLIAALLLAALLMIVPAGLWLARPLWQWSWMDELPSATDVRTEPARPILRLSDVQKGSAFDLLRQAAEIQEKMPEPASFVSETTKLNLFPWREETFPSVAKRLDESKEAMGLLRTAITVKDPQMPTATSPAEAADSFTTLFHIERVSTLFQASAARKIAAQDFAGAFDDLRTEIAVADLFSRGSPASPRLSEIAESRAGLTGMRRIALQNDVPAQVTQETIHDLGNMERHLEPWTETFREEWRFSKLVTMKAMFDRLSPQTAGGHISVLERFRNSMTYLGLGGNRFSSDFERYFGGLIKIAAEPYDPERLKRFNAIFSRKQNPHPWWTARDPIAYILAEISAPMETDLSIWQYQEFTELRATEAVLAIRQFQAEKKRLPQNLAELVPDYLPSVPIDPFDGKPFRYALKPDNGWIVYSVGPNQKDEGGLVAEKRPRSYDKPGDIVYSSVEVEDARKKLQEGK